MLCEALNPPTSKTRVARAADRRGRDAPVGVRGPGSLKARGRAGQGHLAGSLPQHHHQRRRQLRLHLQRGRPHRRPRDPLLQRQRRKARIRALAKRRHGARDEDGQGHQPRKGLERSLRDHGRQPHRLLHAPTTASTGPSSGEATARRGERGWSRTSTPGARAVDHPPSRTSTASSTSPLSTAPIPGCGEADGTEAGTTLVKAIGAYSLTDVNGTLYFASSGGFYSDLWRSDGTEAGTTLVKPHLIGASGLTDFNGNLYFSAGTVRFPRQRALAKRRHRGRYDDRQGLWLGLRRCLQSTSTGILYITASPGPGPIPNELWRSDGTEAAPPLSSRSGGASAPASPKGRPLLHLRDGAMAKRRHTAGNHARQRETQAASPSR